MIIFMIVAMVTGIVITGEPLKNTPPAPQEWTQQIGPRR